MATSLDFAALLKEERRKRRVELQQLKQRQQQEELDVEEENRRCPADPAEAPPSPPFLLRENTPISLEQFHLEGVPTVYYVPDFIDEVDEAAIMAQVDGPVATSSTPSTRASRWETLRTRRLQCFGGAPTADFVAEVLPLWLEVLSDSLVSRGVLPSAEERPSHALVNEYRRGQGILPHTDGPFYHPLTVTLSLGSDAVMSFAPRLPADEIRSSTSRPEVQSLVLRRRALVIFTDSAYSNYLHSIAAVAEDVVGDGGVPCVNLALARSTYGEVIERGERRVSITLRRVRDQDEGGAG